MYIQLVESHQITVMQHVSINTTHSGNIVIESAWWGKGPSEVNQQHFAPFQHWVQCFDSKPEVLCPVLALALY